MWQVAGSCCCNCSCRRCSPTRVNSVINSSASDNSKRFPRCTLHVAHATLALLFIRALLAPVWLCWSSAAIAKSPAASPCVAPCDAWHLDFNGPSWRCLYLSPALSRSLAASQSLLGIKVTAHSSNGPQIRDAFRQKLNVWMALELGVCLLWSV